MILERIFRDKRIIGLAGGRNTSKTNNLIALIEDFRKENKDTPVYVYGLDQTTLNFILPMGNIFVINSLEQLVGKSNCLIIIDEFQKLHLSDKRYREMINDFISMIYHPENNDWLILCSPDLKEFNSIIGSKIEIWMVTSLKFKELVNGSPLKEAVNNYRGQYKQLNDIVLPKGKLLVLGCDLDLVIDCRYIEEADSKKNAKNIFLVKEKKSEKESEVSDE